MQAQRLRTFLDNPSTGREWLKELGLADPRTGYNCLLGLAKAGLPLDLLAVVCQQFEEVAPRLADIDMALNNLERFLLASRNRLSTVALFERDPTALPSLLLLLTASQNLSNWLCIDPESYDLLRMTDGLPYARESIVDELIADMDALETDVEVMAHLRRFKRRETLRIAYGDIVNDHSIEQVTRQISYVAEAVVEAALGFVHRKMKRRDDQQGSRNRQPVPFVVLALGKLGGAELNYSSDIDLVFLYETPSGDADSYANHQRAVRIAQQLIRLLTESTELGIAYRVDMRLRPEGRRAPLTMDVEHALAYYDLRGRTWERQAYIKARVVAGDTKLGEGFLQQLQPWIYRTYLSMADIVGIKALKRRIENRARSKGVGETNVKTGLGGIRDIEFVIQFLQLLNGGAVPSVRTTNTLEAIKRLEQAGCLTHQERTLLEENYRFLRRVEHRLQVMFDLQTHELPTSYEEQAKLGRRLGYDGESNDAVRAELMGDYERRTAENRKILDHLLHDTFSHDAESQPEVDLVNDPNPSQECIAQVLGKYPFRDPVVAYEHLMSLANENRHYLSERRSRLFLASIAPRLLPAIALTPDADATLVALSRVSDSLGGKAALWELFSENPPSLNLYVTLCAACPYLAGILTGHPGMIDELMDSLLTSRLPNRERLKDSLEELTRGAEDLSPILHSFKASQHMRIGVRDILGKDEVHNTHQALADTAEVCLLKTLDHEYEKLVQKLGRPTLAFDPDQQADQAASAAAPWQVIPNHEGQPCDFVVVAVGKQGGLEPNFHSDLDLLFLYEGEGVTQAVRRDGTSTSNSHFFGELAQRVIKAVSQFAPHGQLYAVDARLRPTGSGGRLAVSFGSLVQYYEEGEGQLWERQTLCKARVLNGSPETVARAQAAIRHCVYVRPWKAEDVETIRQMRSKLQESASTWNLKRGPGGTMDIEFLVQMLQLQHGQTHPDICEQNTLRAIRALAHAGLLDAETAEQLQQGYRFQRNVESRIRLMDSSGRHEYPTEQIDLARLALLLGYAKPETLSEEVAQAFKTNREIFNRFFPPPSVALPPAGK